MRVGELVHLREKDLDLDEGLARVDGKGSRQRQVFIPGTRLPSLLRAYVVHRGSLPASSDALLVLDGGRTPSASAIRHLLRQLAADAGLSRPLTPHMLRHTAATLLLDAGVDIRLVQRLLGHSSIATTQIYTHVSDTSLRAAISRAGIPDLIAS
jgi:integrase/recombinase XerD